MALKIVVAITEKLVEEFTEYGTLDNSLAEYTLTPDMLMNSATPLALITARDDSVIPMCYFDGLEARAERIDRSHRSAGADEPGGDAFAIEPGRLLPSLGDRMAVAGGLLAP